MATFTIPVDAFATGQVSGNPGAESIQVSALPIEDFLATLPGPPDPATARIILTIDDQYILTGDTDGDGTDEQYILDGTPFTSLQIDVDGDGVPEYDIRGQNPNDNEIYSGNQEGDNIARFNGNATIYETGTNNAVATLPSGNLYISNNGPFPDPGGLMPVVDDGSGTWTVSDPDNPIFPLCFTRGVMIDTPDGPRAVEDLKVGDLLMTLDHGPQPLRWVYSRTVPLAHLKESPALYPIRIRAGALGPSLPSSDLLVSPQHRILLSSKIAETMFGVAQILVPAKKLLGMPGIESDQTVQEVEYFHILCDQHEIVIANGAYSETLLVGPMALKSIGLVAFRNLAQMLPALVQPDHVPKPARDFGERRKIDKLLERHRKHDRALFDGRVARPKAEMSLSLG